MTYSPWIISDAFTKAVLTIPINVSFEEQSYLGRVPMKPKTPEFIHASHSRPCIIMFPTRSQATAFCASHIRKLRHSRVAYKRPVSYTSEQTAICLTSHFPTAMRTPEYKDEDVDLLMLTDRAQAQSLSDLDEDILFALAITAYALYFFVDQVVCEDDDNVLILNGSLVDPCESISAHLDDKRRAVILEQLEHAYNTW